MTKLLVTLLIFPTIASAHSGRTNSEGCHNNRKTGGYHCHNSKPKSSPSRRVTSESNKSKSSEKKKAAKILSELEHYHKVGVNMEPLRGNNQLTKCGQKMRKNQKEVKALKAKAQKLSNDFIFVRIAANTYPDLCVSCMTTALEKCTLLKNAINEAKDSVK